MLAKRIPLLFSLVFLAAFALAGCGARAGAGETAAASAAAPLVLDLPNLTIDYDANGTPSLGGAPMSSFGALLPASLTSQLTFDKSLMDRLATANIQHIQVTTAPDGLIILVNGEPIPSVRWDSDRLTNLADLVEMLGPDAPAALQSVLPIITNLGAGLALRFPLSQGAEIIPMQVAGDASAAAASQAAQQAFMAKVGTAPIIRIPVLYDADGGYTVQGMSDAEWQVLTGAPFGSLRLQPDQIAGAVAAGITGATVRTDAEGIHLALNGKELPVLGWGEGELSHALKLAAGAGLLEQAGMDGAVIGAVIDTLLPVIQSSNVEINVTFPDE